MFSKKTAVAAAALLAAFAAQAQVTVYGNLDLSVGRFKEPNSAVPVTKATTRVESGSLRESFLGFKGEEDLGGGMKAFFKLESALAADTGAVAGNFWGRTSVIGLSGDFGTVTLGNARSLLFLANDAYNPFRADSALFSTSALLMGNTGVPTGYSSNWVNSITYMSPNMSGFSGAVQLGASEKAGVSNSVGLALNYAVGPLGLNFTYQDVPATATPGDSDKIKTWLVDANYDLGMAKLFGQVGQARETSQPTSKYFQFGVSVPVTSADNVLVSYAEGKNNASKAKEFSLAYEHTLSKRTSAYVGLNSTNHSYDTERSGTSFAAGVRHSF